MNRMPFFGSPPQAWGQPHDPSACAHVTPVHPHKRGDSSTPLPSEFVRNGSPPQAWGQLSRRQGHDGDEFGSPPQAWGQRFRHARQPAHRRFTPTSVGTAAIDKVRDVLEAVHPHKRGDSCWSPSVRGSGYGSPPQAWGQPRRRRLQAARPSVHPHKRGDSIRYPGASAIAQRFTPTSVGTALPTATPQQAGTVHPHKRGDSLIRLWSPALHAGSPPQAWGQPNGHQAGRRRRRFTPTSVGTALIVDVGKQGHAVHPHKRGDSVVTTGAQTFAGGSPPQAWGQRLRVV